MKDDKEIEKDLTILAKSSIFVFVAVFLSKFFMYLYRISIARYYGPESYGLFSLGFVISGFFITFASLGFSEGISRFIPMYRSEKQKIKYLIKFSNNILFFSAFFSAFLLFFNSEFIAINFFHNSELTLYLKIFSFLIPIQIFTNFYFSIIRSHEKIHAYSFGTNILQNMTKFLIIILFIYLGLKSLIAIPLSYLVGILSGLIFAYLYCKFKLSYIFTKITILDNKKNLRLNFLSYSWPLVLYGILGSIMYWIDTFLIGYFENAYWVGIYNAAIPIALLLVLAPEIFLQMFFPLITRELSMKNFTVVRELSKQITKWIFILNLPLTILILLFPGVFINILFGPEYLLAKNALRILTMGYFILTLSSVASNLLLSKGKSKIILINLILTSILNFILNFILIPHYGITGAAFATFISLSVLSLLLISENYYFNHILPFRRNMAAIFFISLILSGILYNISLFVNVNLIWLIVLGGLFGAAYLGLIILTKSFDKNDLMVLKKIFNGIKNKL